VRNRQIFGFGQLGRRLALAFVAVAVAAIGVEAAISANSLDFDINRVAMQQEGRLARSVAMDAAVAYSGKRWSTSDLQQAFDVAGEAGAGARLNEMTGRLIGSSRTFSRLPARNGRELPVVLHGRQIGWVTVRFGAHGLGAIARDFEARRWRARFIAACIAALLALVVSVIVARSMTAPLEQLLAAARARGSGARSLRIAKVRGVGVVRELLESFNRSTDALDARDRLQRNLVADVAHELRTPTAVLQASLEAMLDGVREMSADNIAVLRDEVLRLTMMMDDLQRLAAAEAASLQLSLARHDLAAIAGDAACTLADALESSDVGLEQRLSHAYISCDAARMREVITNLLTNALKFTPPGGSVTLQVGPDQNGAARMEVSDTGIGIPSAELPHVTERFFRGARPAGLAAGTGIGLTIVAELVHAHQGRLAITSEVGQGTRVMVTLPAAVQTRGLALQRSGS
jgi:two-component system sensor histidine kinase BaeS